MEMNARVGSAAPWAMAKVSALASSSWRVSATLVVLLGIAAGAAANWLGGPVASLYLWVQDGILSALGLGVLPVGLWLLVLVWASARRRRWFRRSNRWLGSAAFVAVGLAILSFFEADRGLLASFTMDGDVSLGGNAGSAIIGPGSWQGFLRVLGVLVVAAAITSPPKAAVSVLASSRVKAALGISLGAAAAIAAYWSGDVAGDIVPSTWHEVVGSLGLGVVPVVLWLATLLWALAARRSWLRHGGLWLGSLALLALTLGILAFFQPYQGALAAFSQDGDVSLGGRVGETIIGSVGWVGVLRLLGIFVLGSAMTTPAFAADVAGALARLAVPVYLALAVAIHPLVSGIGSMLRGLAAGGSRLITGRRHSGKSLPSTSRGEVAPDGDGEPNMPSEVLSPYTRERSLQRVSPEGIGSATILEPLSPSNHMTVSPTLVHTEPGTDDNQGLVAVDLADTDVSLDGSAPAAENGNAKYNKLWTDPETGSVQLLEEPAVGSQTAVGVMDEEVASTNQATAMEWTLPSHELLMSGIEGGISEDEIRATAETIRSTLAQYGVEVEIGQAKPGPTVTMYGLIPGWVRRYKQEKEKGDDGRPMRDEQGRPVVKLTESKTRVKVDTILSREKDLALALKTPSIRIETPAMGKSLVGIEIPNPSPNLVTLRSVMESAEFTKLRTKAHLPVALGKGSGGETVVIDLAKMPHLLIAGATGSGKSACLNAIISCLIVEKTPAELRLLLIDPKRVELTPYNGIPHLLTPVVVETDQVVRFLKGMISEMLDRYRRMEEIGVRNIEAYNKKAPAKMPFLVVAIDELADLMMSAAFDVEQSLCRLAQLGRATGIHLIVATQRPSVDVVTGLIKANFPSRISFGVTSQVDSRTILDTAGADKLLGRGDMLYLPLDASRPARVQGVFISDEEIERVVTSWQSSAWAPLTRIHVRAADETQGGDTAVDAVDDSLDELLDKAIALARSYSKLSTSLLQRRLRVGYPRAARLMDQLEDQGIVGPSDGSKSRDVIIEEL